MRFSDFFAFLFTKLNNLELLNDLLFCVYGLVVKNCDLNINGKIVLRPGGGFLLGDRIWVLLLSFN